MSGLQIMILAVAALGAFFMIVLTLDGSLGKQKRNQKDLQTPALQSAAMEKKPKEPSQASRDSCRM